MMLIFLTEYEEDGKVYCGPYIISRTWEQAEEQAKRCNIKIDGTLVDAFVAPPVYEEKERVLH